jgi:hypothetical protein
MPDTGQKSPLRNTIAAQAVSDEASWLILQPVQQALEEPLGGRAVSPFLHQDIEHRAVLIHRTPEIVPFTLDPSEDLTLSANSELAICSLC